MHSFYELCTLPDDFLHFMCNKFENICKNRPPSLGVAKGYYQWPMQDEKSDFENVNYCNWVDNDMKYIETFFNQYVTNIFRFRFSLLKAPYNVDWHCKHLYPRIHIPLNECDAVWELKENEDSDITVTEPMKFGKAYVVDVRLLHRVVSKEILIRKNAFFCFEELK